MKTKCQLWDRNEIYDLKTDLYRGFGNRIDETDEVISDALSHPYSYFVHSYYVPLCEETIAKADYILPYSASLHKDNFFTCQFHPGKKRQGGRTDYKELLRDKRNMIELIPAIDLINGQCVRLTKGDYDQKKVYNDNPAGVAKQFESLGFKDFM